MAKYEFNLPTDKKEKEAIEESPYTNIELYGQSLEELVGHLKKQGCKVKRSLGKDNDWNIPYKLVIIGKESDGIMEAIVLSGLPYQLAEGTIARERINLGDSQ